jgi:hypothetical protein
MITLPPAITLTPPATFAPTDTLPPTVIPTFTPTQVPFVPQLPTFTPLPPSTVQYILQPGTPITFAGFPHPGYGCNWLGIGGQVFDLDSKPVLNLVLTLKGTLNGQEINLVGLTGAAQAWGPGGYEFKLADQPVASDGTLWLQVFNLKGVPISDRIFITTYTECSKNSIMVNMKQITEGIIFRLYLPAIP